MKYAYPAIFTPENGKILVSVPDIETIHTFGDDIPDALIMAKDAIEMWLWSMENEKFEIPPASSISEVAVPTPESFISMVAADTNEYRKQYGSLAVKKTLTIPAWLNYKAEQANAPFSHILQEGLKQYLKIS